MPRRVKMKRPHMERIDLFSEKITYIRRAKSTVVEQMSNHKLDPQA